MEHAINVSAKHFINKLAPTTMRKILEKGQMGGDSDDDGESSENSSEEVDIHNALGKALALIKQVSLFLFFFVPSNI
jgi:hypothetical protein